jgi:hypothetical protein
LSNQRSKNELNIGERLQDPAARKIPLSFFHQRVSQELVGKLGIFVVVWHCHLTIAPNLPLGKPPRFMIGIAPLSEVAPVCRGSREWP